MPVLTVTVKYLRTLKVSNNNIKLILLKRVYTIFKSMLTSTTLNLWLYLAGISLPSNIYYVM